MELLIIYIIFSQTFFQKLFVALEICAKACVCNFTSYMTSGLSKKICLFLSYRPGWDFFPQSSGRGFLSKLSIFYWSCETNWMVSGTGKMQWVCIVIFTAKKNNRKIYLKTKNIFHSCLIKTLYSLIYLASPLGKTETDTFFDRPHCVFIFNNLASFIPQNQARKGHFKSFQSCPKHSNSLGFTAPWGFFSQWKLENKR